MFLLPSVVLGFVFAVLLGGRPSRVLELRFRATWAVFAALGIQIAVFSGPFTVPRRLGDVLHVVTYVLLVGFGLVNRRLGALAVLMLGTLLNAVAIAANGGVMPLSRGAADAAGLAPADYASVSDQARHLRFLGDVFALPKALPLANVFSVGDLLIGVGMAAFIVAVSLQDAGEHGFRVGRPLRPLRNPAYRRLLGGKLVSTAGDWVTLAALVGWEWDSTRSTLAVAATLLARLAPPIVGGGVASYVVDLLPKGRLLAWIEVGRGGAVLLALGGVLTGSNALVLVALALSGLLASVSSSATPAIIPALVPADELPSANAGLGLVQNGSMALGAGGAGIVLATAQVPWALGLDLLSFAVAALLFARLPRASVAGSDSAPSAPARGIRYVWGQPRLLLLVVSFSVATFATGLANATLPRFLSDDAGLGAGAYGFGLAALAAGLALGEVTVGIARVGPAGSRWIGAGLLLAGGIVAVLAFDRHGPTVLLFLGLLGYVDGSTDILYDLVIQRGVEGRHLGAVFGFSSAATATTMVTAFALSPLFGRLLDAPAVIVASGGIFASGGVLALTALAVPARGAALVRAPAS